MEEVRRKTESMFKEFQLLYEANWEAKDILQDEEVDLQEGFDINEWRFGGLVPKENELQRYLKSPVMILVGKVANDEFDVLAWWKVNQGEFPILSHIAIDLYSIPGMSAEIERVSRRSIPF